MGVRCDGLSWWFFRLQSGEKTEEFLSDDGFKDLDWSLITSLVIGYDSDTSELDGLKFYNS